MVQKKDAALNTRQVLGTVSSYFAQIADSSFILIRIRFHQMRPENQYPEDIEGNVYCMSDKWKTYAAALLAGIVCISTSTYAGTFVTANASAVNNHETSDNSPDSQTADGNRTADNDPADNQTADGQTQTGSDEGNLPSGNTDGAAQPDNTGQDTAPAGQTDDTSSADSDADRSQINANIKEVEPTENEDTAKDDLKIEAEITQDESDGPVVITEQDKPYLALGANLNDQQKHTVLSLMGIDPANLDAYQVATVTNEEEHQYLDGYLDASIIGTRALSSVVIVKRDKGDGIHISTKNISYCTIGMYKNALATAGLKDADVMIAAPFPISGTAALIGAMKAYADMENEPVDPESLDAAMNEIVVTGELNESLGDEVQTEEFMAYIKQKVVEGGLESKEKIRSIISEACEKFEITLNDQEQAQITSLMEKIGSLDIDVDSLLKQAGSIYDSLKEMEKNSGFLSSIADFFKRLLEAVIQFFQNLF